MSENSDKVVFATEDVTLHTSKGTFKTDFGDQHVVESVSLDAGDTVEFDKLPEYQQKSVEDGSVPGVRVVSKKEAEKLTAEVAKVRASVDSGGNVSLRDALSLHNPDGSYSDHEVSFEERRANHEARAEEEAGEEVPKEKKAGRSTREGKSEGEAEKAKPDQDNAK